MGNQQKCETYVVTWSILFPGSIKYRKHISITLFIFLLAWHSTTTSAPESHSPPTLHLQRHEEYCKKLENASVLREYKPAYDKYITSIQTCSGLANMMWRYASLYAIGRQIGREVYFDKAQRCTTFAKKEATDIFPEYSARQIFIDMTNETVHTVDFAKGRTHCCRWDDPEKLRGYDKHKFLELNNWNLQHPKYIEHIKCQVRQLFECSRNAQKRVGLYAKRLLGNALNTSHKFCVHTRVGDFKSFGIESKLDFVNPAIAYVLNKLKNDFESISIIQLGEDKDFIDSILSYSKMDKSSTSVFVSRPLSRGDDLCLGMTYCDTLLITAPASSFAWWIGYLMPEGSSKVYYNSDLEAYGQLNTYEYDNFPSEWLPIRLAPDNNSIVVDEDAMKFHENRNYNFPTH